MERFTAREQLVMRMRSEMDDGIEHSYVEVAELLDLTRERIRTIQSWTLVKIRRQREAERRESRAVAAASPPLPGKAKIDVKAAKRWLARGTDKPWHFPIEEVDDHQPPEREGNFFVQRPAPRAETIGPRLGGQPKQLRQSMFGLYWLPRSGGLYLQRYGLIVPALGYCGGRTTAPSGRTSILPAWRGLPSADGPTVRTVRIEGKRGPFLMTDSRKAKEKLEQRALNILRESRFGLRLTTADGLNTLRGDQVQGYSVRSETRKKTKAERAAERARLNALCEALELLTGEAAIEIEARLREQAEEG